MVQLLLFSVGEIRCAIPLAQSVFVTRMVKLIPSGSRMSWEAGILNLHGTHVPVISMRSVLGLEERLPRVSDMLIVARADNREIALWVDATAGIQDVSATPAPPLPDYPECIRPGIWPGPDGIYHIYDLSLLLPGGPVAAAPAPGTGMSSIQPEAREPPDEAARIDAILELRARKIAQPEEAAESTAVIEVLRFRLAYQEYALEMQYIREVILTGEITPVPGTPEYIAGICVVRGEIISLVDLRVLLAIPQKGLTDLNRVIVLSDRVLTFGILADHITGIGLLELGTVSQKQADVEESRYIKGITDGHLTVLDAAALFADPKMLIEET
jgi:chemotaxis signal transduction protein